jgi:hypothetical protein
VILLASHECRALGLTSKPGVVCSEPHSIAELVKRSETSGTQGTTSAVSQLEFDSAPGLNIAILQLLKRENSTQKATGTLPLTIQNHMKAMPKSFDVPVERRSLRMPSSAGCGH